MCHHDVSSQLNLQQHLPWSSGYLGYLAFTINLALGVKQGPGEEGHGEEGGEEADEGGRNIG